MIRAELAELGVAIGKAQAGCAAFGGYWVTSPRLDQPKRLQAALERLQRQAQEQIARWSRVVVLCQQLRGPGQADTEPPPSRARP